MYKIQIAFKKNPEILYILTEVADEGFLAQLIYYLSRRGDIDRIVVSYIES